MRTRSLTAVAVLSFASHGLADTIPGVDLRGFSPPTHEKAALNWEPSATPRAGDWNAALWAGYAYRSVVLEDRNGREIAVPLRHQLSLDYAASIGVIEGLALNFSLPTVLYQEGDATPLADPLPRSAIGDAKLGLKLNLLKTGSLGGLGLAALGRMSLPTGAGAPFLSDDGVAGDARLLAELRLLIVDFGASLGGRFRTPEREFAGSRYGQTLPWGALLQFHPQVLGWDNAGAWRWSAEVFGEVAATPTFGDAAQSSATFGLSQRYTLGDVSGLVGVLLPLVSAVGRPAVSVELSVSWAPRFYDEDEDQVADDRDECPELAEDGDGFEDADGCPEFDNDGDSVADPDDQCPAQAEDRDDFQDTDGCADPDNDQDGLADAVDRCPSTPEGLTPDPTRKGCPAVDSDADDVLDSVDRCPKEAEDKDGHEDADGCPDRDNDRDGVIDLDDRCIDTPGVRSERPEYYGCPNPDTDADTLLNEKDRCPTLAEDFDGDGDDDGCPDDDSARPLGERAKPLVALQAAATPGSARLLWRGKFTCTDTGSLSPSTENQNLTRAIAAWLNQNREWVAHVSVTANGVGPTDTERKASCTSSITSAINAWALRGTAAQPGSGPAAASGAQAKAGGGQRCKAGDTCVDIELRPSPAQPANATVDESPASNAR